MQQLIAALIVNLILTIIFIISNSKKEYMNVFIFAAMFLLVPFFGFIVYFLPHLLFKIIMKRNLYDHNDLIFLQENEQYVQKPNLQEELDIVPFNEMLAVGETREKRALMLGILKKDMLNNSRITQSALNDSDSETSHYAAAATMEVYRKIKLKIQGLEAKLSKTKSDVDLMKMLLDEIYVYVDSGVLSLRDRRININKYIKLFDEILKADSDKLKTDDFIYQIDFLIETNCVHDAEVLCRREKEKNPSEAIYLKLMEIYFNLQNKPAFDKTFLELKQSAIILSNKGLEILRFWMLKE